MEKEQIKIYQDKLFQSKSRKEFDSVCAEIKIATENDAEARTVLRNYLSKIKDKKFEYFEKYDKLNENKRIFPTKVTYLLQDDLAKTLNEYLTLLVIEKKKQLGL